MAGTKVRIQLEPNLNGILGRLVGVQAVEHAAAEQALSIAQREAPVTTGHYEESLEVDENRLLSTDPMAHLVEWGSIHNRAYATLRNAAGEVAQRLEED